VPCCGALLWCPAVVPCCGALLWCPAVVPCCGALLWLQWQPLGGPWEAPGRPLGGPWEAPGRPLGGPWEAPGRPCNCRSRLHIMWGCPASLPGLRAGHLCKMCGPRAGQVAVGLGDVWEMYQTDRKAEGQKMKCCAGVNTAAPLQLKDWHFGIDCAITGQTGMHCWHGVPTGADGRLSEAQGPNLNSCCRQRTQAASWCSCDS
jgi:hypothetical protein